MINKDAITFESLKDAWYNIKDPEVPAVFHWDEEEDWAVRHKYMEAIELVMTWFGTPHEIDEFLKNKS